jgi:hypothetical protein
LTTHASVWNGVVVVPSAKAFEPNKDAVEQGKEEIDDTEHQQNNQVLNSEIESCTKLNLVD